MREIRLIDAGSVSALRSHTLYHAISSRVSGDHPDTLVLSVPTERYVSLGLYQLHARQIDVGYCREKGIPILRRQIGGGAHVLGPSQLLFQTVFHIQRSERSATRVYQEILRVAVDTYQDLHVDAHYLPFTDIYVRNARISAGALGRLDDSVALASSLACGNDPELEGAVLSGQARVESTSIERELGSLPDCEVVKKRFLGDFERKLGVKLIAGSLTEKEEAELERLEGVFSSSEWLQQTERRVLGVEERRSADEKIAESHYITPDGLTLRATVRAARGLIDQVAFTGDFLFYRDHLNELETSFRGAKAEWDALMTVAQNFYLVHEVDSPGAAPNDWVSAISNALNTP